MNHWLNSPTPIWALTWSTGDGRRPLFELWHGSVDWLFVLFLVNQWLINKRNDLLPMPCSQCSALVNTQLQNWITVMDFDLCLMSCIVGKRVVQWHFPTWYRIKPIIFFNLQTETRCFRWNLVQETTPLFILSESFQLSHVHVKLQRIWSENRVHYKSPLCFSSMHAAASKIYFFVHDNHIRRAHSHSRLSQLIDCYSHPHSYCARTHLIQFTLPALQFHTHSILPHAISLNRPWPCFTSSHKVVLIVMYTQA